VALIANPSSLSGVGSNMFRVTSETASPTFGTAGTGGRGKIKAGALEASTVDMAREFTNLIVFQRGYQANSRVITTADEMSQETLNLKR
jgi:flagellar hook protein FlgE